MPRCEGFVGPTKFQADLAWLHPLGTFNLFRGPPGGLPTPRLHLILGGFRQAPRWGFPLPRISLHFLGLRPPSPHRRIRAILRKLSRFIGPQRTAMPTWAVGGPGAPKERVVSVGSAAPQESGYWGQSLGPTNHQMKVLRIRSN